MKEKISVRSFACLVVCLALASSCVFSTKPIYSEKEITIAERATSQFHELHNQQNFSAIYDLLAKRADQRSEEVLSEIRANYEKLGRSVGSRLVEKKVFPSPAPGYTSQVKLAYETKFEKGEWTEFFAWNIRDSSQAVLIEYLLEPTANHSPSIP